METLDEKVVIENEQKTNKSESESIEEAIQKDMEIAGIKTAIDKLNERNEELRPYTEEIYENIEEKIRNGELTLLDGFNILGRVIAYLCQSFFDTKEEYEKEFSISRRIVSNNIIQSLGVNANNEELNKSSIVEYKGKYDERNFATSRVMLISSQIIDYSMWQLELSGYMNKELAKEESANKVTEEKAE